MGLCANNGEEPLKTSNSYFHQELEVELNTQIVAPTQSSLFNTLRKTTELVVLHPDNKSNRHIFANTLAIGAQGGKQNQLKTLVDFKKVVIIGSYQTLRQTVIKQIKSNANCGQIYLVSESFCLNFVSEFPIFKSTNWQNNKLSTSQIPILAIDSKDIVGHIGLPFRVYIHASNKKDLKVYGMLGIDENSVIKEFTDSSVQKFKEYYFSALNKHLGKNIVLLHSPKTDSTTLCQIFTTFLKSKYEIPAPFISLYLAKSLSKVTSQLTQTNQEIPKPSKFHSVAIKTPTQIFKGLFQQLQSENGVQRTERGYNLLSKLLTNIYSNQGNDMYRKVKRTNKQINQLLNGKAGRALLNEIGFREEGEHWTNNVQSKYLKIFKTGFDLGYKNYKQKQSHS